ncbi:hypothetical protein TKK_0006101 [Trichogramma kaykai]
MHFNCGLVLGVTPLSKRNLSGMGGTTISIIGKEKVCKRKRGIEVDDSEKQMAEIAKKLRTLQEKEHKGTEADDSG